MNNLEHYELLAEHIAFCGIPVKTLEGFVKYRPGKTYRDAGKAIRDGSEEWKSKGCHDSKISLIAAKLSEVVEIDTNEPLQAYKQRLEAIRPRYSAGAH